MFITPFCCPSFKGSTSDDSCCTCRFGDLFHDWPESYFKAQQSRGAGLADIFQQAMGAAKAQKIGRQKSILARMFPGARMASMFGPRVGSLVSGAGRIGHQHCDEQCWPRLCLHGHHTSTQDVLTSCTPSARWFRCLFGSQPFHAKHHVKGSTAGLI